jgi:hypothetical protein
MSLPQPHDVMYHNSSRTHLWLWRKIHKVAWHECANARGRYWPTPPQKLMYVEKKCTKTIRAYGNSVTRNARLQGYRATNKGRHHTINAGNESSRCILNINKDSSRWLIPQIVSGLVHPSYNML